MDSRFTAMVVLERDVPIAASMLSERLASLFPAASLGVNLSSAASTGTKPASLIVDVARVPVLLTAIDRPIPEQTFENAIATNMLWPGAVKQLSQQRAHVIVSTLSTAKSHADAMGLARLVTFVAAAVADVSQAIGVYWSAGDTITAGSQFVARARTLAAEGTWPLDAWLQFRWLNGPNTSAGLRTLAIATTGLQPFVGWELEFAPTSLPPKVMMQRVVGVADYLLSHGPVLQHDETIGVDAKERIRVRHVGSGQRPGVPVLLLTVERISLDVA